jgi:hypothetical protein
MMIDSLEREDADAEAAADPAVLRAEKRLRCLEEIAEIGMRLLRALPHAAEPSTDIALEATAADGQPRGDTVDHYARLSRSLRLTLALEAKTDEALARLKSGLPAALALERAAAIPREQAAANERRIARRRQISECLRTVAESEAETREEFDDLNLAMNQRLDLDPLYEDLDAGPLREIVERLCHDLCLHPDWSRWTDDGWSLIGPRKRPSFSAFNEPSPRPVKIPPRRTTPPDEQALVHDLE